MELQKDDLVSVLQTTNKWSSFQCSIVEQIKDNSGAIIYRVKFPNSEIKRVYHDRIRPFSASVEVAAEPESPVKEVHSAPPEPKKIKPKLSTKQPEETMTTSKTATAASTTPIESTANFNPWTKCPKAQVYMKENSFNPSTVCKTITIIDADSKKYYTVNTYNGKDRGLCAYNLVDTNKLIAKLVKKGYKQVLANDWK